MPSNLVVPVSPSSLIFFFFLLYNCKLNISGFGSSHLEHFNYGHFNYFLFFY